jgi:hypothetical protein
VVAYTLFFNNTQDNDQSSMGPGIITGQDPRFTAAPNPGADGAWETVDDDFSGLLLQSSSPAIDKGVTQLMAANGELIPPSPITGFIGAAPDLGWREFGSPVVLTPTASPIPSPTLAISPTVPTPTFTLIATTAPPTATVVTLTPLPTTTQAPPTQTIPPVTPTATVPSLPTMTITPTAAQLSIVNVTPNAAAANTTVNVTISGTAFANNATVTFEGAQGTAPQVTAIQVVNANTIVVTVNTTVGAGATTQMWDVRVTNPDNTSAVRENAFTVTVPS